jgi:predicted PurR-regulated permease PerM
MTPRIRGRLRRRGEGGPGRGDEPEFVAIEPGALARVFTAPSWLRDLGIAAWLLVGVTLLLGGAIWLLSLTETIVIPVAVAAILAAVLSPLVGYLEERRVPRALATVLVFLLILGLGGAFGVVVLNGITSESANLSGHLRDAADEVQGWLEDLGVSADTAESTKDDASSSASDGFHALLNGLGTGISALASLAMFLAFTALSLFFLLKDGPQIRAWAERHVGVPPPVASTILGRTAGALRGYFAGVTVVAAFNGLVIGLGALVIGVPLAGSIAIMNFAGAYIPYLGAWTAGAVTVLIALGSEGTDAAIAMAVIALLANGMLQQIVQPIAYGATLGIHPLAVLIVTIAAGSLFGILGLVLAAPLISAAVRISADLARARGELTRDSADEAPEGPGTSPEAGPAPAPG